MIPLLEQRRGAVADICRRLDVERLDVFGSAASGSFDPARSDIDLIVSFADKSRYLERFLELAESLERVLGRNVDLLTERSIKNPVFRQEVERHRLNFYDASQPKVSA